MSDTESIPVPDDVFVPAGIEDGPAAEPERQAVACVFLVVVNPDGHARALSADIEATLAQIAPQREASIEDMRRACHEVVDDVTTSIHVETVLNMQMQMAKQMQAAQQEAERKAQTMSLLNGGDLKKGLHLR